MKTLLERLKPELIEAMNEDAKKFPAMMRSLKKELSLCVSVSEMTIENAYRLTYLTDEKIFGYIELFNCFLPND